MLAARRACRDSRRCDLSRIFTSFASSFRSIGSGRRERVLPLFDSSTIIDVNFPVLSEKKQGLVVTKVRAIVKKNEGKTGRRVGK